jgi:hypothetical protein
MDEVQMRRIIEFLEDALKLAEEIEDSETMYLIEPALDEVRRKHSGGVLASEHQLH